MEYKPDQFYGITICAVQKDGMVAGGEGKAFLGCRFISSFKLDG